MSREQAIAYAQSELRDFHKYGACGWISIVHFGNTVWRWRKYGWKITLWENGDLVSAIDEWKAFRY